MGLFSSKDTSLNPTLAVKPFIEFDDTQRKFHALYSKEKRKKCPTHDYSELREFEFISDGETVMKGGVGRAMVGGALFGAAGAVVGAATQKSTRIVNRMEIQIITSDFDDPVITLAIFEAPLKTNSGVYTSLERQARKITDKLTQIAAQNSALGGRQEQPVATGNPAPVNDPITELRRYSELLQDGIITQEEFAEKKRQLLGSGSLF